MSPTSKDCSKGDSESIIISGSVISNSCISSCDCQEIARPFCSSRHNSSCEYQKNKAQVVSSDATTDAEMSNYSSAAVLRIENTSKFQSTMITNKTYEKKGFPKRFIFVILGCLGFINMSAMRFNFSVTMVAMVKHPANLSKNITSNMTSEVCPELIDRKQIVNASGDSVSSNNGELNWDPKLQQLALASFYVGYLALQIPGGILAEKYYPKYFYGFGELISAFFTILTPVAARYSIWALIAVRVIQGLGKAPSFSAMSTLISRWSPTVERTRISTTIYNGLSVGAVVSFALSGLLCDSNFLGGWPSVFYVFGALGCIWYIFWELLIFESPETHPHITKAELEHIRKGQDEIKLKSSIPWTSILTSIPFWGLNIAQSGLAWGYFTFLTELPIYLNDVLHFDLKKNGLLCALPILISVIMGYISSIIADKLRKAGKLTITSIRKILTSFGFYGCALCVLLVTFAKCSSTPIIILLCLGMGFMGVVQSNIYVTYVDMSPDFSGTLISFGNTAASITGILVPIFVGWILQEGNPLKNWRIIFMTVSGVYAFSGTVYNVFCSAEIQKWRTSKEPSDSFAQRETISSL